MKQDVSGGVAAKPPDDEDVYQGMSWTERAAFGKLGAVLDPADREGKKNAYIDALHRTVIRKTLKGAKGARALDFGCGSGRFLPTLSSAYDNVYGVDRTPAMLELARTEGAVPDENLQCWRAGPLPFTDAFFDYILSVYVFGSALPIDQWDRCLSELRRVSSANSRLVMIEQVKNDRGLTEYFYKACLQRAGYRVLEAYPVRSSSSRYMRMAMNPKLASSFAAFFVLLELKTMSKKRYTAATKDYYDYCFVAVPNTR